MQIPSYHQGRERREDFAMTPMIDIVFLLLIFFVCASVGQIRESLLPAELSAGAVESPLAEPQEQPLGRVWLRLDVNESGQTVTELNNRVYSDNSELQRVLRELAELAPEIPVILDIAPEVPLGDMIRVYDACQAADFHSIHFATDPNRLGQRPGGKRSERQ